MDLKPEEDTASNATVVLKIDPYLFSPSASASSVVGKYLAVRDRLEADRLISHWRPPAATKQEAVNNMPGAIAASVTCDGDPYYCWDHDFLTMFD